MNTKPPKSILDPAFRYVPSGQTDLRKTFARLKREAERSDRKVVQMKEKKA